MKCERCGQKQEDWIADCCDDGRLHVLGGVTMADTGIEDGLVTLANAVKDMGDTIGDAIKDGFKDLSMSLDMVPDKMPTPTQERPGQMNIGRVVQLSVQKKLLIEELRKYALQSPSAKKLIEQIEIEDAAWMGALDRK